MRLVRLAIIFIFLVVGCFSEIRPEVQVAHQKRMVRNLRGVKQVEAGRNFRPLENLLEVGDTPEVVLISLVRLQMARDERQRQSVFDLDPGSCAERSECCYCYIEWVSLVVDVVCGRLQLLFRGIAASEQRSK